MPQTIKLSCHFNFRHTIRKYKYFTNISISRNAQKDSARDHIKIKSQSGRPLITITDNGRGCCIYMALCPMCGFPMGNFGRPETNGPVGCQLIAGQYFGFFFQTKLLKAIWQILYFDMIFNKICSHVQSASTVLVNRSKHHCNNLMQSFITGKCQDYVHVIWECWITM